jgi:protein-disulfide isomerase
VRASTIPFLALMLAACSGISTLPQQEPQRPPVAAVVLPGPVSAPPLPATDAPPPKALPGLEIDLAGRESALFWRLASQIYAPCPDQAVSLRQCVEEARPCAACLPAARLLADKVKDGVSPDQARDIYGTRFGPNVKQVDPADSPSRGPEGAPLTVMVWSDFECPHCRLAMPLLERSFAKFSPKIRLVHKFYPLRQHSHAEGSARAAIAAQNQGKYWEMERVLFEHQSEQSESDLDRYAQGLGLDMKRFHADMTAERTSKILERDHADAEKAGLSGTPFILVNGREFDTGYFHVETDLDPWLTLELQLLGAKATR